MALVAKSLSTGKKIEEEENQIKPQGKYKSISATIGRTPATGLVQKKTPQTEKPAGNTPTLPTATQKPAKLTPRQFGIGFGTTTPVVQKNTTLPQISGQTLQKAQQLSQKAQGKTPAQLMQQNTQAIKKLVELPKADTKQYGVGFGQPVVQQNENKKVSPFLPAADPQITQKAKQVAAQPGTSDAMYYLKAARSGLGNAAAGLQNVYEIGKLSDIEKMNGEKTDFVKLGEGLSKEKNIIDNIAVLMNNLATNLTAAGDRKFSTVARRWLTANKIFTDETAKENGFANKEAMIDAVIDRAMKADNWNDEIQEDFAGMTESRTMGQQMAASLIQAVAQMAPTILANMMVPGSGTGVIAGQVYGNSAMDALNQGATLQQAKNRGLLSAGVEAGTEKLFGGIPGLNKGFVKLGKVGDILGEGVEEGLSTAAGGAIDRATFDPDAKNATWDEIVTDAALGIGTAGLLNLPGGIANIAGRLKSRADVPRISAEDFANTESPIWHNVDYADKKTQAKITTELAEKMRSEGKVVSITQEDLISLDKYYPDLRTLKKKERLPLMKKSIAELKDYLRGTLSSFKDSSIDFTVNGNILEARLYNTGINEVLEKVSQDKAAMLEKSKEIFANAEYLYSTGDKNNDPNIYRWNYFYVPLDVNGEQVGVRIAVRDMVKQNESQLYNWGIKKGTNTAIDGDGKPASPSATSVVPNTTIAQQEETVKRPASLRQRAAQTTYAPTTEERSSSAEGLNGMPETAAMLRDEESGVVVTNTGNLEDVAAAIDGGGSYMNLDIYRVLDKVAGNNSQLRQRLYEAVEKPLNDAKNGYARNVVNRMKAYKADMDRLGIKAGSKESAAVQWIGEGVRQTGAEGETTPYTMEMLQRDFPTTWRNIVEAERIHRQMYDEYVDRINAALSVVYPGLEAKAQTELAKRQTDVDDAIEKVALQQQLVRDLQARADALTAQTRSNDLVAATRAKQELIRVTRQIGTEINRAGKLSEAAKKAVDAHDKLAAEIEGGAYYKNKRLRPRKDYFHHFVEMEQSGSLAALKNILNRPSDIAPELVGVSDYTKPKSKWWGALQRRTGAAYTEDAVGGMARYIPAAEYKISIDPYIAQMRGTVKSLVDGTKEARNANGFIEFLTDWTNDLAGKSNPIDRGAQKVIGRKAMKVLEWVNNRVKANAVVGNIGSAIVQIGNIPNATTYVQNPAYWTKAAATMANTEKAQTLLAQSPFLTERYMGSTTGMFDQKNALQKGAEWLLEIGDQKASELIWLAAYNQYEDGKAQGPRQYDNAVDYADDVTRRSVAGRGVGELPLTQRSRLVKLFAPFQVEVNNTYNLMKEQLGAKNAKGLAAYCASAWIVNSLIEAVANKRPLFDPIQALIDAIKAAIGDEEEEGSAGAAAQRLLGETVSNIPYASTVAPLFFDTDDMEKVFGEQDPTRYGTGISATADLLTQAGNLLNDKPVDWLGLATTYVTPYGGQQLERFVEASQDAGILPRRMIVDEEGNTKLQRAKSPANYNDAGKLRFALNGAGDIALDYLFGPYATSAGREYVKGGGKPLSEKKTLTANQAVKKGIPLKTYQEYLASVDRDKNGSVTQAEARKTLNQMELTEAQKRFLFGKTNTAWKNNPFK